MAAASVVIGAVSCSDNNDPVYEPVKTDKELVITPDTNANVFNDQLRQLTLSANASTTTVKVKSNTRWKAQVDYEKIDDEKIQEGWCHLEVISNIGDSTFNLTITENLLDTRKCTVTVVAVDANGKEIDDEKQEAISSSFTIIQNFSNIRLSPSSVEPFAANDPESKEFQVIVSDKSVDWTLSLSYEKEGEDFMRILPGGNMQYDESSECYKGKGNSNFTLSLQPNRIAATRVGFLTLTSDRSTYNVEIKQNGSQYTFDVSAVNGTTVNAEGGVLEFGVFAPLIGWKITGIDHEWMEVTPENGEANENDRQPVRISVYPNNNNKPRTAALSFVPNPDDEKANLYTPVNIEITQAGLEYIFTVISSGNGSISANGGVVEFTVESPQKDWVVDNASSLPSWIHFSSTSGGAGNKTVRATIDPNISLQYRYAQVKFATIGENSDFYRSYTFEIYQNGFNTSNNMKFNVSPFGPLDVFDVFGDSMTLTIDTDFDWEIQGIPADQWITVSPTEGTDATRYVTLDVAANTNGASRSCALLFVPLPTDFRSNSYGSFTVNPEDLGVQPVQVNITQYGGLSKEPAISVPWLAEGYSQTAATVEFNYYSPFHNIAGAGIQWKEYMEDDTSDDNWNTLEDEDFVNNGADGYVSVELTGLKAATKYVARGYVVCSDGKVKYGDITFPFTTAGIRPGGGDNPTPEI